MTSESFFPQGAVIGVMMLVAALFAYGSAVGLPSSSLIFMPSGEARPIPVEMLRPHPNRG